MVLGRPVCSMCSISKPDSNLIFSRLVTYHSLHSGPSDLLDLDRLCLSVLWLLIHFDNGPVDKLVPCSQLSKGTLEIWSLLLCLQHKASE